jgi:putative hydrolase of the HAD superfamily
MVTKGEVPEQSRKIDLSGLARFFSAIEIVPEKDPPGYRSLVEKHGLTPAGTWMIGNSPRSDINPAMAAGLNAVYIPHSRTWVLERDEIQADGAPGTLIVVERFADLRHHF